MSKESYMVGFCKKAAESNVDPQKLARFVVQKAAETPADDNGGTAGDTAGVWQKVMDAINAVKKRGGEAVDKAVGLYTQQDAATKALIGAGIGSAVGTGIGAAAKGKKGLRSGAVFGALGGLGTSAAVDWKQLSKYFDKMSKGNPGTTASV